jgi:hypothetical protein
VPAHTQQDVPALAKCWCCGSPYPDTELLHLGEHPEVGICPRCARSIYRRAVQRVDEQHPTTAARLRGVVRTARERVIGRGWHNRPIIGTLLRRIDRHLP